MALFLGLLLPTSLFAADVTQQFNRAMALQQEGKLREAEAEYRRILSVAPNYAEAHANLGAVLVRLDRYEEAVRSYKTALKLNPNLKQIHLNIGIAHYRHADFARAVDSFRLFLKSSPGHGQALSLTALSLVELGRDQEALEYLAGALAQFPGEPALVYALGLASLRLGKPMVTGAIEELAALPRGKAFSLLLEGQAHRKNNRSEQAVRALEEAEKLNPDLPRLQYSLGLAYHQNGRDADARRAFETQLSKNPNDVPSLWYLALLDEQENRPDAAMQRLRQALRIDPQSADSHFLIGKILLAQGNLSEAMKHLEVAVTRDPVDPAKRASLARALRQAGRTEEASRQFAEARRLQDRADEEARKALAPKP